MDLGAEKLFTPYKVGAKTKLPKLKNLSDFGFENVGVAPRIYPLSLKVLKGGIKDPKAWNAIRKEIVKLTGNRLVVRTDCIQKGIKKFNLPRTDTVDVDSALSWCFEKVKEFTEGGIKE